MNIQGFYTYSWFANLAYVNWRTTSWGSNATLRDVIDDANNVNRVPGDTETTPAIIDTLGEKIFFPTADGGEGWHVANFSENDDVGFSATLFANE